MYFVFLIFFVLRFSLWWCDFQCWWTSVGHGLVPNSWYVGKRWLHFILIVYEPFSLSLIFWGAIYCWMSCDHEVANESTLFGGKFQRWIAVSPNLVLPYFLPKWNDPVFRGHFYQGDASRGPVGVIAFACWTIPSRYRSLTGNLFQTITKSSALRILHKHSSCIIMDLYF